MTTAFKDIERAIQGKLAGILGAPDIDFEGVEYTPTLDNKWWRLTFLAGNTQKVTIGGLRQHTGIYQVDIFVPVGDGLGNLIDDMDLIASTFDTNDTIDKDSVKVQINGVSPGQRVREDAWMHGILKINYVCFSD